MFIARFVLMTLLGISIFSFAIAREVDGDLFQDLKLHDPKSLSNWIVLKKNYADLMKEIATHSINDEEARIKVSKILLSLQSNYPDWIKSYPLKKYPQIFLPRLTRQLIMDAARDERVEPALSFHKVPKMKDGVPELKEAFAELPLHSSLNEEFLNLHSLIDATAYQVTDVSIKLSKNFPVVVYHPPADVQELMLSLFLEKTRTLKASELLAEYDSRFRNLYIFYDRERVDRYQKTIRDRFNSALQSREISQQEYDQAVTRLENLSEFHIKKVECRIDEVLKALASAPKY